MGSETPTLPKHLDALKHDGFVIIRSLLNTEQLSHLREATHRVIGQARAGNWPHVRTLPKQFPPWTTAPGENPAKDGIWGVQNLMDPALPGHELFTNLYFSEQLLGISKELLSTSTASTPSDTSESQNHSLVPAQDSDLVMELLNLLVRPDHDFALRWHRDDIPATASADEELERLSHPAWHTQWNLPLYADSSLIVIPGSHARARTEAERGAEPFEPAMPGQIAVQLEAGDCVFYNNNILHRGVYDCKVERATLHGSVGHVRGGGFRARNVLQHGVGRWVDRCDFAACGMGSLEEARAEGMRARLWALGKEVGDVGFFAGTE